MVADNEHRDCCRGIILAGIGGIGAIMAAKKFGDFRALAPKFLCIQCNRYYRDISEHMCYHRRD